MTGVVTSYFEDERRKFGFIEGEDGEIYFAGRANIAADEYARVFLEPGELVIFRPGSHAPGAKHREALDIVPARVDENQSAPENHKEEFVVTIWSPDRMSGMASRPDGKGHWHYVNFREVQTYGFIQEGTHVWSGFRRSRRDPNKFELCNIEIIKPVEKEN
jgi:hypothetical protein